MTTGFAAAPFLASLPWSAAAVLLVLLLTGLAARHTGRHSVIDTAWGLLFVAAAVAAFVSSSGHGDPARRWLLLFMTVLWGLRLAVHIGRRSRGKGEDPRYEQMLAGKGRVATVLMVYGLQGVLAYAVSAPVQVGSFEHGPLGVLASVGIVAWIVGVLFEGVGDWQLERYRADPHRAAVLDHGLWRYTRHPNYFGDACVWVGIFLAAAEHWPGVLTMVSPAIMIFLLAFGSGKRVLERHLATRPAYRDYMQRTSGFVPMPPRRG